MTKGRLEAFSDGVLAIIITIMVLELKVPHEPTMAALSELFPIFLCYLLSFIYVGIYWNNHHHLLHVVERINGGVMWANMFLLFCLSLIPFTTAWMGENHFAAVPVALYGGLLLCCSLAYFILVKALLRIHSPHSALARSIGKDFKGKISSMLYVLGIILTYFIDSRISSLAYVVVAIIWLVPDRRIEKTIE